MPDQAEFIKEIATQAGELIMEYFGKAKILYSKDSAAAIVTEADLACEKLIVSAIKAKHPTHGICAEESGKYQLDSDYVWYIDPIDGTKNFESRVPLFGINIALAHNGEMVLAAINSPATGELAIAEKGRGAFLIEAEKKRRIHCSEKTDWIGAYGIGPTSQSHQNFAFMQHILGLSENTAWVSGVYCPAVSAIWMADGRRDWYISPGLNPWDFAAPYLVCKEAGCLVSNYQCEDWKPGDKGIAMSNPALHPQLLQAIRLAYS